MTTNLNHLVRDIAWAEDGKHEITIAQIKEVLGILGKRWRGEIWDNSKNTDTKLPPAEIMAEINAIVQKAGRQ